MLPLGDLFYSNSWAWRMFPGGFFLRPNSSNKCFTGFKVYNRDDLKELKETVKEEEICVISSIKEIYEEYRFVIRESRIIGASKYWEIEDSNVPKDVYVFVERILDNCKWSPDKCWTLDINKDKNGTMGLVEINSFSSSGLYKCELSGIIKEISEQAWIDFTRMIEDVK
jgi:hypothetical protein